MFMIKKLINSILNCDAYSSFEELSSDHWIVSGKIRLSLHRKKKQTGKASRYDCSSLAEKDINNHYPVRVRNQFYTL